MLHNTRQNILDVKKNSIIQQNSIFNKLTVNNSDLNSNINLSTNILKEKYLDNYYRKLEQTKIIQFNTTNMKDNSTLYNAKFDISSYNLKNVVKCDLVKAVIPKTRQLLHESINYNGNYNIDYCFADDNDNSNIITNSKQTLIINNSNYSVSELENYLHDDSSDNWNRSIINIDSSTTITNHNGISYGHEYSHSGLTVLSGSDNNNNNTTKVIISMSNKIAYILGFCKKKLLNPFDKIYSFVNYTDNNFKIKLVFNDNTYIESNTFSKNKAYTNLNKFLECLNNNNFKINYIDNKYVITADKLINNIYILKDDNIINGSNVLSDIIGITSNKNIDDKIYHGNIKYFLEFNTNTPNDGTLLVDDYKGLLISKYPIEFIDTYYVNINIDNIGTEQPIELSNNNKKYILLIVLI